MWYVDLADKFQFPLVNADRMMMSILPEVNSGMRLPAWASTLRDRNQSWMQVAQKGVEAFVAQAIRQAVSVADAAILTDNSRELKMAFTVCRVQIGGREVYDRRHARSRTPAEILEWLNLVSPQTVLIRAERVIE